LTRCTAIVFLIIIGVITSSASFCLDPILKAPVKIQADGADLDADTYSIPRVYDWNNDGKKDLIIGQRYADKVRLYLNSGTDAAPVFTTFSNLQAGGVDIYHAGTGCGAPAPEILDWNNDGKKDLLVGTSDGYVYLYLQSGTSDDGNPQLLSGTRIQVNSVPFSVGSRAVPCINDWNEDGKKDLLIGNGDGYIIVLINLNTDGDPRFDSYDYVYADLQPLSVGIRASPRVCDWNGDGYKDIIAGEGNGRILFYENIRTNNNPDFSSTKVYLNAGGSQINLVFRSRPCVVDWNNDGLPDILCGNFDGYVFYFEHFLFTFESISCNPVFGTILRWRSRPNDTYTVYCSSDMVQWDALDNLVPSQGAITEWSDSLVISETKRLYKIQLNE